MNSINLEIRPISYQEKVEERRQLLRRQGFLSRLQNRDFKLWFPELKPEILDRLGWLDLPERSAKIIPQLKKFAEEIKEDGIEQIILLGMGGSSLAVEVFAHSWASLNAPIPLQVLDSTHPRIVAQVGQEGQNHKTLFIVSSKSGTTIETLSLFRYFWELKKRESEFPGSMFVAITDEGTPLEKLALERGFRAVFHGSPDVGGRFSALSVFGLLPAALLGIDLEKLIEVAHEEKKEIFNLAQPSPEVSRRDVLIYPALLGSMVAQRDKITFFASSELVSFLDWLEQLLAESLGKDGQGLIPIIQEPALEPGMIGPDRLIINFALSGDKDLASSAMSELLTKVDCPQLFITLPDIYCLGAEMFRWEVSVALLGSILGVHPFNQPDVALAKVLTREMLEKGFSSSSPLPAVALDKEKDLVAQWGQWLESIEPGDYVGLQAFLPPTEDTKDLLSELRKIILTTTKAPTSLGFGPRFLHSTGQLHKGGPNKGVFLQLIDSPEEEVPIPETPYSFGQLIRAQADGDFLALKQRGRRVLRVHLGEEAGQGLAQLIRIVSAHFL